MVSASFSPDLKSMISWLSQFDLLERSMLLKGKNLWNTFSLSKVEKQLISNLYLEPKSKKELDVQCTQWGW
jgi:hypothetical protein